MYCGLPYIATMLIECLFLCSFVPLSYDSVTTVEDGHMKLGRCVAGTNINHLYSPVMIKYAY